MKTLIAFLSVLGSASIAHAQTNTLVSDSLGLSADNLGGYLNNLFELALLLGAILAVLIIASAGLQYMSTDAVSGKTDSRERIVQAVLGLLMLLGIWIFFTEINPNILKVNFTLEKVSTTGGALDGSGGGPITTREPTTVDVGGLPTVLVETERGTFPEWQTKIVDRPSTGGFRPEDCGAPPSGYSYHASYRIVAARCPSFNTDTQVCCQFKLIE